MEAQALCKVFATGVSNCPRTVLRFKFNEKETMRRALNPDTEFVGVGRQLNGSCLKNKEPLKFRQLLRGNVSDPDGVD